MNRVVIFFVACFLTVTLYSQDRVNKKLPKIGTKALGTINSAKGWLLNPEGQWISRQNRIPQDLPSQQKELLDYGLNGLGIDNFISFEFRNVTINDSNFIVLIKKYNDGYYKYSSINEGWTKANSIWYYVITKNDYDSLTKKIIHDTTNTIKLKIIAQGNLRYNLNEKTYINDIEKSISTNVEEFKYLDKIELCFHIAPYIKKNIVRFSICSIDKTLFDSGSITIKGIAGWEYHNKAKDHFGNNSIFDVCYYEVPTSTFKLFLKY